MEHCPILRHLYSKSSWMGRVIPLRLLALPAELKQLCSSSLVVGSRNISMNGCLVHKQGCLSQPHKGFFTCSPVFTCFLVIGRRVGRRLVVSWVWVCGRRGTSTTPTTTSTNSTNSTNGLSAHTEGPPHVNSSCKADWRNQCACDDMLFNIQLVCHIIT